LNAQTAADPLSGDERVVYDADEYLGSIMMDGHLLTFCNKGPTRIGEMGKALEQVGATQERALLKNALNLWVQHGCASYDEANETLIAFHHKRRLVTLSEAPQARSRRADGARPRAKSRRRSDKLSS
jgi:hypothetical protein